MFKSIDQNHNFIEMEKKWLRYWEKKGIIKKYFKKNLTNKYFSFLDGPITANNPMGVHHAWGRTYKDLWQKFYNLLGYKQRFQNGFDCQGLWVEVEVEKELGLKNKKAVESLVPGNKRDSIAKFVNLCKQRVYHFSKIQTKQSKRLGYFMDWDNSYYTMSDENNYMIWHFLKKCYQAGWIYKGKDSVPWCPRCETAISEHEILTEDYKEVIHESIYFTLPIVGKKNEYLLVWTTTPWTIPANIAVAVDEAFNYSQVEDNDGNLFWIAYDLIKKVFKGKYKRINKIVKGKELVGLKYITAFDELPAVDKIVKKNQKNIHIVVATDQKILPISTTEGTGLVHTAVSAGTEDFRLGKKLGLPMIPIIADNADYLPELGFLTGKNAKKNPRVIFDYLMEKQENEGKKWVFEIHKYKHRYPACWRCKTELVWKVTDEWYIAMDKQSQLKDKKEKRKKTLREKMIEVAKKIRWMPEFGLERELDWLKNMHDWLISKKNRYWGLALPIFECRKCGYFEVVGSKEELKKKSIEGWEKFEGHSPHKPYIDEVKINCQKCDSLVSRIDDVGNPWLDAGIVSFSTITENNQGAPLYLTSRKEWRKWFPADFITESFPGQFKNWFYALIAMSTVLENTNPFKTVLGFGTLLGEDGRPMHKSWGNSIEFNEGADQIGVDVMRWMFSKQNPAHNLLFGYKKADEVRRQFYLILWNVYKFFVEYANLDKYSSRITPIKSRQNSNFQLKSKNVLDKWILSRFIYLVEFVEKTLKNYNAKDAVLEIEKFVNDLSTWYVRRSRERVWINSEDKEDKQWFYQTLHYVLFNLAIILSPILPFITEEIFINLLDKGSKKESVHLSSWPKVNKKYRNKKIELQMELARRIVEAGHAKRKNKGIKVRKPLLKLEITIDGDCSIVSDEIWELVLKELNIKNLIVNQKIKYPKKEVIISEKELNREGKLRELLRQIQIKRKELCLQPTDRIKLIIPYEFNEELDFIKKKVLVAKIEIGEELKVEI